MCVKNILTLTLLSISNIATAATLITPQKITEDDYRFSSAVCHLQLDVNPQTGGRITQLIFDKHTIMTPYGCNGKYDGHASCNGSGSTFWTSPQRAWPVASWPPVVSVDGGPYAVQTKHKHLLMSSASDDALGANVDKDISIDEPHCTISLRYTINAARSVEMAPWEITRVPRGGIALFPVGDDSKFAAGPLSPRISRTSDSAIAWFDDTTTPLMNSVGGAKLIADGREGWLAYVRDKKLFIKKFSDVPASKLAPNEGDVEIYPGDTFLELEVQGPYTLLKQYDQLPWTVEWRIVNVPKSVKIAVGSESLLKFVREQVSSR